MTNPEGTPRRTKPTMKRLLAAVAATCAIAVPAAAQFGRSLDQGTFAGRFGIFFPAEQNLRDFEDIWFAMGVDFEIPQGLFQGAMSVIAIDWFTYNGGSRNQAFPITFNQRFYRGSGISRMYFQVGAGVAVLDFGVSDNVFCARGGVGMEFNERNFAEANFVWVDSSTASSDASGFTIQYGIRF